jgi:septum formation protein
MQSRNTTPPLILASASPRRSELLRQARIAFIVVPSSASEELQPGEAPDAYALRVAQEKARDVARRHSGSWILAADTIVEIDGKILGKPRDEEAARHMLQQLSGHTHQVKTAFVLLDGHGRIFASQIVTSTVTFRPLSETQIQAYLATGEPFDKAGAYAIQGQGATLITRVEGSYTNVVGLPLDEVLQVLHTVSLLNNANLHD